jgi:hypothetical protein
MKKIASWLLLGFVFIVAFGLFVLQLLSGLTEKQRLAAVTAVKKPESVAFYEGLAAGEAQSLAAAVPAAAQNDGTALSDREIMARWARLFERVQERMQDVPEWEAIRNRILSVPAGYWADGDRRQAEALADELAEMLAEIREMAAIGGPITLLDGSDNGERADYVAVACVMRCVELLRFEAAVQGSRGNQEQAADSFLAIIRLGNVLAGEPSMHAQEFVDVLLHRAFLAFVWVFEPGEFPQDSVQDTLGQLARADGRDRLALTLAARFHHRIEARRESWSGRSLVSCVKREGLLEGAAGWLWVGPVCRPFFNQDEQIFAELTTRLIRVSDLPYYKAKPVLVRVRAEIDAMSFVRSYAKSTVPRLMREHSQRATHESRIHLMQLGIAVEAHCAEHGVYPAALKEIAAQFPDGLPVDPFSGAPYHYTCGEGTFLLYGVGSDCEDDGGEHKKYYDGDMVWRAN